MKKIYPTPLEKLQSDKLYAKVKSRAAAQRLNNNITYIQNNTGSILLSSAHSLLFPGAKEKKEKVNSLLHLPALTRRGLSMSDVFSLGKSLLPHAWTIAKPILFTWGVGRTRSILLGRLFGWKKKKKK